MPKASTAALQSIVLTGRSKGLSIIPQPTPLTRLRFFDGKFLRAADFELEQRYHRELVAQSNRAGGSGVVHGFDCTLAGDGLTLGSGLAIDPSGRVLLLPEDRTLSLEALIDASRARAPIAPARPAAASSDRTLRRATFDDCLEAVSDDGGAVAGGSSFYLIVAFHAEALCGEEDVYGKLCEEACATSTERPYVLEGVVVRAVPLDLTVPLPSSTSVPFQRRHLRSRVASAWFEQERRAVASLISAAGLASGTWCRGAAAAGGSGVPLALVARAGSDTLFLDAWTARRERIEPPPRRYWAGVMAMRPWDVFLAQVLQFQCQLRSAIDGGNAPDDPDDPCAEAYEAAADAAEEIGRIVRARTEREVNADFLARSDLSGVAGTDVFEPDRGAALPELKLLDSVRSRLALLAERHRAPLEERVLLTRGIVELPPAGYLPVPPDRPVEPEVRRLLGNGLDLRFCAVRPDFVPHALEEAQHMERISLTAGLDDPKAKPRVDVLVPDGVVEERETVAPGTGYETAVRIERLALQLFGALSQSVERANVRAGAALTMMARAFAANSRVAVNVRGAARGETLPGGGSAFYLAGRTPPAKPTGGNEAVARPPAAASRAEDLDLSLASLRPEERLRALEPLAVTGPAISVFDTAGSRGALWLSLRIDRDPFALSLHGTAEVGAEIDLLHPTAVPRTVRRLRFTGTLTVDERRSLRAGGVALVCRLAGDGTTTSTEVDVPSSGIASFSFDERVELSAEEGTRGAVRVRVVPSGLGAATGASFEIRIARTWPDADRSEVACELVTKGLDAPAPVFAADERVDPAVLQPGNASHDAALAALGAIGSALGDARFADAAARKLFPPPDTTREPAALRATRDWVLFHRRRDKDCGERPAPETRVGPRRYRVFQVAVRSADQVRVLAEALARGASIPGFAPRLVGSVDFGAGIQAVETPSDEVRNLWAAQVAPRTELVYGALASQGAAVDDGVGLARARLGALARTLAPVTPLVEDVELEVLPDVPASLSPGGGDGVVVFATTAVATVCNDVYRVVLTEPQRQQLLEMAGDDRQSIQAVLKRFQAVPLGKASFRAETAEPFGAGLGPVPAAWREHGNGPVSAVVAFVASAAEGEALAKAQAGALVTGVGGGADGEPPVHLTDTLGHTLGECPVLTLLVAQPVAARTCHEVVALSVSSRDQLEQIRKVIAESGLSGDLVGGRTSPTLGEVTFAGDSEEPDAEPLAAMVATWTELANGSGVPQGFTLSGLVVSRNGASDAERELHRRQGETLLTAISGGVEVSEVVNGSDTFPVECDALTLAVLRRTGTRTVVPVVVRPEDGGSRVVLTPRFDEEGELIRDAAFERDVEAALAEGVRFDRLSLAEEERPGGTDRRLVSLFEALKEKGLVTDEARRTTRTFKVEDRTALENEVRAKVPSVLILERGG